VAGEVEGRSLGEIEAERETWLQRKAQELAWKHGRCRAAYILRVVYKLKPRVIARLLSYNPSTVRNCIAYYLKRGKRAELQVPPLEAFERYGEPCRGENVYSLECQALEAEMFMYAVARRAILPSVFWDVFLRAASIHRLVFPEIYTLLQEHARLTGADYRRLVRAYGRGPIWVVGDGLAAYTYVVLELAHHMLGHRSYRYSERLREAIGELTASMEKDPMGKRIAPLTLTISLHVNAAVGNLGVKLIAKERELYKEIMEALRKGRVARSQPP